MGRGERIHKEMHHSPMSLPAYAASIFCSSRLRSCTRFMRRASDATAVEASADPRRPTYRHSHSSTQ